MRRLLWVFFATLGLVVLAGIFVALREPKPVVSGPLTLPDGSVVRIVGVTYGTNHYVGPPLARLAARMPDPMQAILKRLFGSRLAAKCATTTSRPTLILWIGRATNNASPPGGPGYLSAFLSDANGFISGEDASVYGWWSNPQNVQFGVFPRRDRVITANFFYHSPTGGVSRCGTLPFSNPVHGTFPQWKPEALPVTVRAGDVAVTLEKLSTGHDHSTGYESTRGGGRLIRFGTNRVDGRNNTVCAIRLHSLTNTNEVWRVAGAGVSDATGNKAGATSLGWGSYEDGYFTFEPGLWPSESAWKLRCEIKRAEGFAPGETFVFRDVPLGRLDATNRIGWMTNFAGVRVSLDHVIRRLPNTNQSWSSENLSHVQFTTAGLTNDFHLDLLSARTDKGTNLNFGSWSSGSGWRTYDFRNVAPDANTADFTFAVQRSRWVEFIVKPEVGPAQVAIKPERNR